MREHNDHTASLPLRANAAASTCAQSQIGHIDPEYNALRDKRLHIMKTAAENKSERKKLRHTRTNSMQKEQEQQTATVKLQSTQQVCIVSASSAGTSKLKLKSESRPHSRYCPRDQEVKKTTTEKVDEVSTSANVTLDQSKARQKATRSVSIRPSKCRSSLRPGSEQFLMFNSTTLLRQSPTIRRKTGCGSFRSPQCGKGAARRSPWHRSLVASQNNFQQCAQYSEKERMKEYFARKKELVRKYENMTARLKEEEASAMELAVLKTGESGQKLRTGIEDIRSDYEITRNLLIQQRLVEEEELLREYEETLDAA